MGQYINVIHKFISTKGKELTLLYYAPHACMHACIACLYHGHIALA